MELFAHSRARWRRGDAIHLERKALVALSANISFSAFYAHFLCAFSGHRMSKKYEEIVLTRNHMDIRLHPW